MQLRTRESERREARWSAEKQAAVAAYENFSISFRCTELDRSTGGARLRLPAGTAAPAAFWLIEIGRAVAYKAETVWRRYPDIGVRLGEPVKLDKDVAEENAPLVTLWRSAGGGAEPTDRRLQPRPTSSLAGRLFMSEAEVSADCVVRDVSHASAKVRVNASIFVSPKVGLLLIKDGLYFDAELVWRSGEEAGLALKDRHDLTEPTPSRLDRAKEIWRQLTG
jgi:hypothetical protein